MNEDRLKFADTLIKHAKDDFDKLGLELDVLKVQSVERRAGLSQEPRPRAHRAHDPRRAERREHGQPGHRRSAGDARQRAESAQKQAEAAVLTKRNQLRAELANFEAAGQVDRKRGGGRGGNRARRGGAGAAGAARRAREAAPGVRRFLPAEAAAPGGRGQGRSRAAPVVESGKAAAEALAHGRRSVARGGQRRERPLRPPAPERVRRSGRGRESRRTEIGELSVVDGGDGAELHGSRGELSRRRWRKCSRETGRAIGVDMHAPDRRAREGDGHER